MEMQRTRMCEGRKQNAGACRLWTRLCLRLWTYTHQAPADATGSSQSLDAGTLPAAGVEPSPRARFVEPPGDAHVEPPGDAHVEPPEVHIESADYSDPTYQDDHQQEDALLMAVGEEEPYRPSPESPSPRQSLSRWSSK
jgi:hypothetical protein